MGKKSALPKGNSKAAKAERARILAEREKERQAAKKAAADQDNGGIYEEETIMSPNGAPYPHFIRTGHNKSNEGIAEFDIQCENIDVGFRGLNLIDNASIQLVGGRKYGLVARNGMGKSTLMRAISSRQLPIPKHIRVIHVEQEVVGDDTTALQSVINSDEEYVWLKAEEIYLKNQGADANHKGLHEVYERLTELDADGAEARAAKILFGLGFDEEMQNKPTSDFSGGWRMRISIAQALFNQPDLLLLDEPNNHLDVEASVWLENYLRKWKNTILITSHERGFLNAVCTDIIFLHRKKLWHFRGNYDAFAQARAERMRHLWAQKKSQMNATSRLKAYIQKNQHGHKKMARQAQCRMKLLSKLEENRVEVDLDDPAIKFSFPDPEFLATPILTFRDVEFGYTKDKIMFRDLNFGIDLDSRVALVGANGVGKSTLMKVLADQLTPTDGHVSKNPKARVGYFTQHHIDHVDFEKSALNHFRSIFDAEEQEVRKHLGGFGLSGDNALKPIKLLSGGQKSRVVFAELAWRVPHIMLLDEPSNHLDLETIEGLSTALNLWEGGLVLISHDERLIDSVCDEIWIVGNHTVTIWDGDFKSYKEHLAEQMGLLEDDDGDEY
eukprot:Clim_evm30s172 gene=Clim_evmTU30s172